MSIEESIAMASHISADGTHVYPVKSLKVFGSEYDVTSGELRWNKRDGLTYHLECAWGVPDFNPVVKSGDVGSVQALSTSPDCIFRLQDDTEVSLIGTNSTVTSEFTRRSFTGSAVYAMVALHKSNELAFWHDTPDRDRLFLPTLEISRWPEHDKVRIQFPDGSKLIRGRGILALSSNIKLYTACKETGFEHGVWLTFQSGDKSDTFWYDRDCEAARTLLSFLTGHRIPFLWKDTFLENGSLLRLYYGWQKTDGIANHAEQPVPLGETVEALTHGDFVVKEIPMLFAKLQEILTKYNIDWIICPLWYAQDAFIDDKLSLACVSLERLAAAHKEFFPQQKAISADANSNEKSLNRIKDKLKKTLLSVCREMQLPEDVEGHFTKKIDHIEYITNREKLESCFTAVGITLNAEEKSVLKERNNRLHGGGALGDFKQIEDTARELLRFDTMRTLINRAVLSVLEYSGPYVDYSQRPLNGNFPIENMQRQA